MSDTPETDNIYPDYRAGAYDLMADHARDLERRLAAAIRERDELQKRVEGLSAESEGRRRALDYKEEQVRHEWRRAETAVRERDELKADRDSWVQLHNDRLNELLRSRLKSDELQAKLDSERTTRDYLIQRGKEVEAERDRLQAALESQIDECKSVHGEAMNIVAARAETAERERDQLRGKLDEALAALREAIAFRSMFDDRRFDKWDVDVWRKAAGMEDGQ